MLLVDLFENINRFPAILARYGQAMLQTYQNEHSNIITIPSPESILDYISDYDPTKPKYRYTQWMALQYSRGQYRLEDLELVQVQ